jgi:hypothetical protein
MAAIAMIAAACQNENSRVRFFSTRFCAWHGLVLPLSEESTP